MMYNFSTLPHERWTQSMIDDCPQHPIIDVPLPFIPPFIDRAYNRSLSKKSVEPFDITDYGHMIANHAILTIGRCGICDDDSAIVNCENTFAYSIVSILHSMDIKCYAMIFTQEMDRDRSYCSDDGKIRNPIDGLHSNNVSIWVFVGYRKYFKLSDYRAVTFDDDNTLTPVAKGAKPSKIIFEVGQHACAYRRNSR